MAGPERTRLLSCPHCHYAFHPGAACMTLDYCPRCLGRRHVAQPLLATDAPPGDLAAVRRPTQPRRRSVAADRLGGVARDIASKAQSPPPERLPRGYSPSGMPVAPP